MRAGKWESLASGNGACVSRVRAVQPVIRKHSALLCSSGSEDSGVLQAGVDEMLFTEVT